MEGTLRDEQDVGLAEKQDGQKETTACQEATEANPEKLKACQETEPDPEMMQSEGEHQEFPKEEAAVMPVGGLRKRRSDRNLAAGRRRKQRGRNRKSRIAEEIGRCRQEGDPPCQSGMAQEEHSQK
jgi:hypothetical protein